QLGALGKRVFAEHLDRALIARQPQHGVERRGLARAIVADKPIDAAGRNVEIEPVQDLLAAERLLEPPRRDDGFADAIGLVGHGCSSALAPARSVWGSSSRALIWVRMRGQSS